MAQLKQTTKAPKEDTTGKTQSVSQESRLTVVIPIETTSRELIPKVYLARTLANTGCQVLLSSKQILWSCLEELENFIYLDKGYHHGVSEQIYQRVIKQGGKVCLLDEEGAVDFPGSPTLKNRYPKNLENYVSRIFFWGSHQLSVFGNSKNARHIVTGHPRFDLLKPEFRFLYKTEAKKLNQRLGDFILVNTNMGFGNNIKGDAFVAKNYGGRFRNIRQIIKGDKLKLNYLVNLIARLSIEYNDNHIVIRPHPEENLSYYRKHFQSNANVHVERAGSVIPWIIAARSTLHIDCTTGIEALMLGKVSISCIPTKIDPSLLTELPVKLSYKANSISEVLCALTQDNETLANKHTFAELDTHFSFHRNACQEVTDRIHDLAEKESIPRQDEIKFSILLRARELFRALKRNTFSFSIDKLSLSKLKGLNEHSIMQINASLTQRDSKPIKISKPCQGAYIFHSKTSD